MLNKNQKANLIDEKNISRFGDQWSLFTKNEGYYGSLNCLADICGPFFNIRDFENKNICDIGSGTGRIVQMLINAGAAFVTAIEPSISFKILKKNIAPFKNRVRLIQATAETLQEENKFDYIVSFGVLHHVVNPACIVQAAYKALLPNGKFIIWLYGREGNRLYLSLLIPLRKITTHLSKNTLLNVSKVLLFIANIYLKCCYFLPLPLHRYFKNYFAKANSSQRILYIFDQLNPIYAKYYCKNEAHDLLAKQGFKNIQLYHRHGYSWTVIGEK